MSKTLRGAALLAGVGALCLTGLLPLATSASAATVVSIIGSAPPIVTGPANVTFSYSITLPTDVSAASFVTHQDPNLAAKAVGVNLDNVAVPAAQVASAGAVDITISTDPAGLTTGTHLLTYQAAVPGTTSVATSSSMSFRYTDAAGPHTLDSAAIAIAINQTDLAIALTPFSGEEAGAPGPLGTGRIAGLAVDVTNSGFGAPQTSLLITLPTGVGLAFPGVAQDSTGDTGALLPCVASPTDAQQVRCAIGAIPHTTDAADPTFIIPLISTPSPPVGTTVPIDVAVAPADATQGIDANPANNAVQYSVIFTGKARLSYQLAAAATKVILGKTTTVKITIHNAGPNVAGGSVGIVAVQNSRFSISGFTGKTLSLDGSDTGLNPNPALQSSRAIRAALPKLASHVSFGKPVPAVGQIATFGSAEPESEDGNGLIWLVGDIPAGGNVSATLTLRAKSLGSTKLAALAVSNAADPACPNLDCVPPMISIQAIPVPKPVVVPPSPVPPVAEPVATGQSDGGAVLAATGEAPAGALDLGLVLVVAGTAMLWFGRRRVR